MSYYQTRNSRTHRRRSSRAAWRRLDYGAGFVIGLGIAAASIAYGLSLPVPPAPPLSALSPSSSAR